MLNFRQIEVFRAIMLTRTMSAAAKMLNASQPGLSRMIKHLEGRLGFLLFDRVHGRLAPTAEARTLFREIEHIHHGIENLEHIVARLATGESTVFRLGASPSLSRGFAPALLKALSQSHPKLIIQFDVLSVEQMADYLVVGRHEYGLSVYGLDHPNLASVKLGQVPLVAVLPKLHPLANRSSLAVRDFREEHLICFAPDTPHGSAIAAMFARAGAEVPVTTRVRFAETACAFVAQGLGVTIVDSQTAHDSGFEGITWLPLKDPSSLPVFLHRNREVAKSKVGSAFEMLCKQRSPSLLNVRSSSR
jgi:DNA-binding transcriptional LysR family regulator